MKRFLYLFLGLFILCGAIGIWKKEGIIERIDFFIDSFPFNWYVKNIKNEKVIDKDHVQTTLFNGMPIIVNKHDRCFSRFIRLRGTWEEAETKVVLPLIKEGQVIVEAGAHYGFYTILMAEKVGKTGKIYSYEANPQVFKYLTKTVELNHCEGSVTLINKALSDHSYQTYILHWPNHIAAGAIFPENQVKEAKNKNWGIGVLQPIEVVTLDADLPHNLKIDLLKMDIEGADFLALKGAQQLIKNSPHITIIMEWIPKWQRKLNIDPQEAINFFKSEGYYCWIISDENGPKSVALDDLMNLECDIALSKLKDLF